ncbi:MAG: methyltransferase domain-containing protein [Alphaproteobacteria bacterium]|nr:methyltransferase domain-containing protein [Alphaproteobacteria bacterium]
MPQAVFELPFWRAFLANPLRVASPVPSGPALARAVAAEVVPGGSVLELGPGSGAVTAALLARGVARGDLTVIEYAPDFCTHLRHRFPGLKVLEGDAFAFPGLLGQRQFKAIVSGLPVLACPQEARQTFLQRALGALAPDGVFIQFSYSPLSPFPTERDITVRRHTVWRNLPPMQIWRYARA